MRRLARIEGLERIRYTTSHPNDMGEDLIALHGEEAKLMPFLHLPVQSGSDRVLKAMNRKHTAESYLRLIERIRAARPDMALSGDFIVGFPGETEADFQATLALVEAVGYAQAYSFAYSPRPGTPAAGRPQVDRDASGRPAAAAAAAAGAAAGGVPGRAGRADAAGPDREAGTDGRADGRASRPISTPCTSRRPRSSSGAVVPVRVVAASTQLAGGRAGRLSGQCAVAAAVVRRRARCRT